MGFDREAYEEQLAERAMDWDDNTSEDFARWVLTKEGQEAFGDFRHDLIGVPDKVEDLDNERLEVFFDWVITRGTKALDDWRAYYVERYNDYEGQAGDHQHDMERD